MASVDSPSTRDRIVEAAVSVFATKDLGSASIAEIARQAEITSQGVYRYFSTKKDLYLAAYEKDLAALLSEIRLDAASTPMPALSGAMWFSAEKLIKNHPLCQRIYLEQIDWVLQASLTMDCSLEFSKAVERECVLAQKEGLLRSDVDIRKTLNSLDFMRTRILMPLIARGKYGSPEWLDASHIILAALYSPIPKLDTPEQVATYLETLRALSVKSLSLGS